MCLYQDTSNNLYLTLNGIIPLIKLLLKQKFQLHLDI